MKKITLILVMVLVLSASIGIPAFAEGEAGNIVSSGYGSTYVIKNDGSLWGWGGGRTGNGNGYNISQVTPAKILDNVEAVSANSFGGVAVKKDDTLWAWGNFNGYPTDDGWQNPSYLYPEKVMDDVKLAAKGHDYIAVIKNDDSLWICGNMYIGDGTDVMADSSEGFVKILDGIKDVFAGADTIYFIKNDNTLWGYGDNSDGELGNMSFEDALSPVKILDDVKKIREFGGTVFSIRLDNTLYSWGNDGIYTENGWVEDAASPYKVMDNVLDVTACQNGSGVLVVKTDNTLWGWGGQWNDEGSQMTPYKYADNVLAVSNGERHAAVVMKDNTLWTMGGNYRGGLGYDSDETWYTPLTKILDNVQDAPASWANDEVEKAIGEQLIPEDMQNNYTKPITREEFCILAIRMIEVKSAHDIDWYLNEVGVDIAPVGTFSDCDTKEVRAAKVLGITDGVGDGKFAPDNLLNREQAAKFLTTTAMACGRDIELGTPAYTDLDEIANWAKPYTGYVYDINVMKGVGGNRFDPQGSYQRQQAFMTMYRIWEAIDSVDADNVKISTSETLDDSVFEISDDGDVNLGSPSDYYMDDELIGDTRDLLLYEVNTITNDEAGTDGMMTQVFYYSDASYEMLVGYFKNLLEGTQDYDVYVQEGRTSIDGTINGEMVIVIVNDYITTEPEVGMNGVNVNFYE